MDKKELSQQELEDALPKPSGHKMLVALPKVADTFDGSIIQKIDSTKNAETITSVVALVLDLGPDAYQDKERFPSGPWCKAGDYVLMRPYQGTRFHLNGQEFRIVNDDAVDGTVADPKGYNRAG